jgi:hypothetical protein
MPCAKTRNAVGHGSVKKNRLAGVWSCEQPYHDRGGSDDSRPHMLSAFAHNSGYLTLLGHGETVVSMTSSLHHG